MPAWAAPLFVLLGGSALTGAPGGMAPSEYEVKAAFIYNFAKFVEWPPPPDGTEPEEFVITVLGQDPFGEVLDETLRGKTVGSRKVVLRRVARAADVTPSHILFISDSEREQLAEILKHLQGAAVLTVGEMDRFAERGGVIRFRTDEDRIRLEINLAVAERARLKISSELLKLARIVGRRTGG